MGDHPEFPQEREAIRYLVEQASKIEDAQACGVGYYKSLGKVLDRLDKLDKAVNLLTQTTQDLKKVTDSDVIAAVIGKKSDDIHGAVKNGLTAIGILNSATISKTLTEIRDETKIAIDQINATNDRAKRLQDDLHAQTSVMISKVNALTTDVDRRLTPPQWHAYAYAVFMLVVGIAIGKVV